MNLSLRIIAALAIVSLQGKAQCLISGLSSSYCVNSAPATLTTAIAGGTLTGPGIVNGNFNPALAGVGGHTLQYSYCSKSYSVTSVPYVNLSNGTDVIAQLGDNEVSPAVPIGFNFKFFCDTFSHVYISSNGFISFSPNQPDGCCQGKALPSVSAPKNIIALYWSDLDPSFGGTIRHSLLGAAPNRTFMVNYNCIFHHNNGNGGDPVTGTILLFETTNIIEINLAIKPSPSVQVNATTGMQDYSGNLAYTIPGKNGTSGWSATHEVYRFTPGPSCEATATTTVAAVPNVFISWGSLYICRGEKTMLFANGANTYSWSNTSTNTFVTVQPTVATVYSVTGTSMAGCTSTSSVMVKVSGCTGLDETTDNSIGFEIFPNPSQGFLNIRSASDGQLSLYNALGTCVKQIELKSGSTTQIDLTGLAAGMYFLRDINGNKRSSIVLTD